MSNEASPSLADAARQLLEVAEDVLDFAGLLPESLGARLHDAVQAMYAALNAPREGREPPHDWRDGEPKEGQGLPELSELSEEELHIHDYALPPGVTQTGPNEFKFIPEEARDA